MISLHNSRGLIRIVINTIFVYLYPNIFHIFFEIDCLYATKRDNKAK